MLGLLTTLPFISRLCVRLVLRGPPEMSWEELMPLSRADARRPEHCARTSGNLSQNQPEHDINHKTVRWECPNGSSRREHRLTSTEQMR